MLMLIETSRDPANFVEPLKFDPERSFGEEGRNFATTPFGLGPRKCPGQVLAMEEIKAVLANLCCRFRFKLSTPDQKLSARFVIVKQCGPLPLLVERI
ncbi:cytochrome P450 [Chytridium lagenaria]|nr:cytochrome P450 [Chytridium lagenaria]